MQTQTGSTSVLDATAKAIVRQGTEVLSLEDGIAADLAAFAALHAASNTLIDFSIAGGGAGNVFIVTAMVGLGGGAVPAEERIPAMTFKWFQASDAHTLQTNMNTYLATLVAPELLWAWEVACAGDGAVWIACLVTWQGTPG